ncbi:C-GCAxxG-C-C family protein [Acetanaerobacterium elongatum]|uniref:C_GCAxxG_C_C family probable redox protein n=1 Tax=Acetanaerobacterium elongatum TaxID=258515 RepID=A0A1H0D801_9FIRM|nr:C-GCAxxG-C-C family protein [Acetanaerobacterium elongatum]SDN66106.1 C_GCAxxG_C_C family probable redox protein [Acetanaerobacterium elongatum]
MDKKQIALGCVKQKFNCAQSTFSAFAEEVGIDQGTALKVASCFGGGMKCGEVCGAVTGVLMAIGMKYGSVTPDDYEKHQQAYIKGIQFIKQFKQQHGSILCKDLLGYDTSNPAEMAKVLEKGLHISVCAKAITDAIETAEDII